MKKLILSAVFALACFSAQAKNEVIKNDDDKNPKSKAKVAITKVVPTRLTHCATRSAEVTCSNGNTYTIVGTGSSLISAEDAAMSASQAIHDAAASVCSGN